MQDPRKFLPQTETKTSVLSFQRKSSRTPRNDTGKVTLSLFFFSLEKLIYQILYFSKKKFAFRIIGMTFERSVFARFVVLLNLAFTFFHSSGPRTFEKGHLWDVL